MGRLERHSPRPRHRADQRDPRRRPHPERRGTTRTASPTPLPTVAVTFDATTSSDGCDLRPDGPATERRAGPPHRRRRRHRAAGSATPYSADVPFAPDRNGAYPVYVCIDGVHGSTPTCSCGCPPRRSPTSWPPPPGTRSTLVVGRHARSAPPTSPATAIERSLGGERVRPPLQTVGPEAPTFTDTTLPAAGGEATYRVVALRPHVADAAPSDTVDRDVRGGPAHDRRRRRHRRRVAPAAGRARAAPARPRRAAPAPAGRVAAAADPASARARPSGSPASGPRRATSSPRSSPRRPIDGFSEELPYDAEPSGRGRRRRAGLRAARGAARARPGDPDRHRARARRCGRCTCASSPAPRRPEYDDPIEIFLDR